MRSHALNAHIFPIVQPFWKKLMDEVYKTW